MAEHPIYGAWADQLIALVRDALLRDDPEAVEPLGQLVGAINQDTRATVGVFGTLVNRLATADIQARVLANGGEEIDELLLSPTGNPIVDHFVASVVNTTSAVVDFGPDSFEATERASTLLRAYQELATDSRFANDDVRKLGVLTDPALRLALHQELRGLDLKTVIN
ncbi:MAG: hypothetical protein WBL06_12190 [Pseudolysinimonas sp.]|uniref:hypothetical protein n=1 Tax=Pseudolysinimonas sp. TaxID=2680009 RepID=UPI003C793567